MKLLLKLPNNKNKQKTINNMVYNALSNYTQTLYPIPSFIEDTCVCGERGFAMNSDMKVLCVKCLNIPSVKVSLMNERIEPNPEDIFYSSKIEWSVVGKDNVYSVHGSNVIPDSNRVLSPEILNSLYSNFIQKIIESKSEVVDGDYNRESKKLKIFF